MDALSMIRERGLGIRGRDWITSIDVLQDIDDLADAKGIFVDAMGGRKGVRNEGREGKGQGGAGVNALQPIASISQISRTRKPIKQTHPILSRNLW
jgi:hypothetical protein